MLCQQRSSGCSKLQGLLEQEIRSPSRACRISLSSALNLAIPIQRLLVDEKLFRYRYNTLSQATASFGSEDHKSHPNKSICNAELKLCWVPLVGHFTGSGLLHRLPCPVPASLPAALRCCSLEARGKLKARSGAKSATDISA